MVSIILPYYNAEEYVDETISSILAQTYKDWGLLIVDDCSTSPNTEKVLANIKSLDSRIKSYPPKKAKYLIDQLVKDIRYDE